MGLLVEVQPAPAWLWKLAAARNDYEERLGWPVLLQVEWKRLVAPAGGWLDAVNMPAALGERVLARLRTMMLAGPVISEAGDDRWVFLTQPADGAFGDVPAGLGHLDVRLTPRGTHVVIPARLADGSGGAGVRWREDPRPGRALPACSVIIGAIRRVAAELVSVR